MISHWATILGLALAQLAAGVLIGRCWPARRSRTGSPASLDPAQLDRIACQIFGLLDRMSGDVEEHQGHLAKTHQELLAIESGGETPMTGLVLQKVSHILQVNDRLKSKLRDAEQKIQQQAEELRTQVAVSLTDPLTGLSNRRAFDQELHRRFSAWHRKQAGFGLVLVDVDYFKRLNDRHGHLAGDMALKCLAKTLSASLPPDCMVARLGGEEFGILMPGTDLHAASSQAEWLRIAVQDMPIAAASQELHLTISLGVAMVEVADDYSSLMRRADEALYASKTGGRNCSHLHDGAGCHRISGQAPSAASRTASGEAADAARDELLAAASVAGVGEEQGAGRFGDRRTRNRRPELDAPPPGDDLGALLDALRNRLTEVTDR